MEIHSIDTSYNYRNNETICPIHQRKPIGIKNPQNYDRKKLVNASINEETGELRVTSSIKSMIDSQIWYTISSDGSAVLRSLNGLGSIKYPKGRFKEIYDEAVRIYNENDGAIPEEDAQAILSKLD